MKLPKGKTEMVMGTVSITFLPYLSERFPTNGITSNDPNPMICIYTNTYNFIIIILYIYHHNYYKSSNYFIFLTNNSFYSVLINGYFIVYDGTNLHCTRHGTLIKKLRKINK